MLDNLDGNSDSGDQKGQLTVPGMLNEIDNETREKKFTDSIDSGEVLLEFPREALDKHFRATFDATLEYLEGFTESNPQAGSFVLFESSGAYSFHHPRLTGIDLSQCSVEEDPNTFITDYLSKITGWGEDTPSALMYSRVGNRFFLVHEGVTYFAMNHSDQYGGSPINFADGLGFRSLSAEGKYLGE